MNNAAIEASMGLPEGEIRSTSEVGPVEISCLGDEPVVFKEYEITYKEKSWQRRAAATQKLPPITALVLDDPTLGQTVIESGIHPSANVAREALDQICARAGCNGGANCLKRASK